VASAERKRIVAIDDEPAMLDLIGIILGEDYEVITTRQPEQAQTLIHEVRPDLILLDVQMPHVTGWTLLRILRADEQTAHIPVIVVTALSGTVDRVFGLHIAHVTDYITKPFTPEDLLSCVAKALGQA
jgi:DNA-binding response OmpR family regulator